MPPRKNQKAARVPLACISLGPSTRLYSEDFFLTELKPLGLTRKGFRKLLIALGVPSLEIGNTRLIDHLTLLIALRSILRIGNPVFLAPGSLTHKKHRKTSERFAYTLDPEYATANLQYVLAELLTASEVAPLQRMSKSALIKAARKAASNLVRAGYHHLPTHAQTHHNLLALKRARDLPPFQPLSPDPDPDPSLNPPHPASIPSKP